MKMPLSLSQHHSSSLSLGLPTNTRLSLTLDKAIEYELKHGRKLDPSMDTKKLRRTISNRLSAQRSRMKKAQYINDMEKMVKDLQEMISVLTPQIKSYKEKRKLLLLQNDSLEKLIEIRSNESKLHESELEQKRLEVHKLREFERTVKKNNNDSDSGQQQIQDLSLTLFATQQYPSIAFYQNGLQHLQKFGCNHHVPNSTAVQSRLRIVPTFCYEQRPGIMIKLPIDLVAPERNQEEAADVDQYLNLEALNVDTTNP